MANEDTIKIISSLAERFPNPDEFISALENFGIPENKKGDFLLEIGLILFNLSNFKMALPVWKQSLTYFIKNKDVSGESNCYMGLGNAYQSLGDFSKAIEYQGKSLKIKKEIGDVSGESSCYGNLGNAYQSLGDFRKAIKYQDKALEIAKEVGNIAVESNCYMNLGIAYRNLGDFSKAIEYQEKALKIKKEISDLSGESNCYMGLGNAYQNLGDFRKAIEYQEKALKIAKEVGNVAGKSNCYMNLGIAYQSLGDFRKAIEYFEKSLEIAKEIGNVAGESNCYMNLGNAYRNLGDFRKAIEYFEKSLEIDKEIGDVAGESNYYTNSGIAYQNLGDFKKAIEYQEKALKIKKEIGDLSGESKCYTNLGAAYQNLGDFKKAIEYQEKALKIKKEIGDLSGESKCYTNLGAAYQNLGDFRKAIEYFEKSLEIDKEIGDVAGESNYYTNLGIAYDSLGDFRKAIEFHEKSLEIDKEIGNVAGESNCYMNLGIAYQSLGDFRKAIEYQEKALKIKKEIGDLSGESAGYTNLGVAYDSLGDFRKAIEFHEKSLEIFKEIGDTLKLSRCYANLGMLYEESDELTKSLNVLKKSVDIRESIKGEISLEELRMSFHAQAVSTYDALSFIYLRLGDVAESINTLERSKTRELADSLFYAEALKDNPKFREIFQKKSRLKHKVEVISKWKNAVSEAEKIAKDASIARIKTEMERIEREYATVSSKLHRLYDEVAGLRPKDFDIISNALDVLRKENGWAVLEYLLLPSKSELVVFVITEKGEINPIRSGYDNVKLDSSIEKYVEAVISSSKEKFREKAESELRELSADLYTILFPKDVENAIEGLNAKHLIIVPHKGLHLVPWEILFNGEDYLGLKYAISKNFSLDLTSIAMNKRKIVKNDGFAALLMGNPTLDLAGAETEVNKIENRLNSIGEAKTITLQRDKATKEAFIDNIKNPLNIFHFSGHGRFQTPPGFSSLVFNNKNELTANELSGLSFEGSPIVSLSACESGITAPISGDELMGLIRGFIIAGSSSIVSTSWRIYDNSACRLMVEFYENLLNRNCVGLSLKKARETVFNDYDGEILHWGAYTLYGDPFRYII